MKKRILSLMIAASTLLSCFSTVTYAEELRTVDYLRVEGKTVSSLADVFYTGEDYIVPLRKVADSKGAKIVWLEDIKTAELTYNSNRIIVPNDKKLIYINNEKSDIREQTRLIDGKMYISGDAVEKIFGLKTYYHESLNILDFVDSESVKTADKEKSAEELAYEANIIDVMSIEDSSVQDGPNSTKNYGAEKYMTTRYNPTRSDGFNWNGYVKFDISGMKANGLGKCTFEVKNVGTSNSSIDYDNSLYPVDPNSWDEMTINWDNQPQSDSEAVGCAIGRYGVIIVADITEYIKGAIERGEKVVSFKIADTQSDWCRLASREADDEAARPRLVFNYNDPNDYRIFDDYPIPEHGKGIKPLDYAKTVLEESTATYDYSPLGVNFLATDSVQLTTQSNTSYAGQKTMQTRFSNYRDSSSYSYIKFDISEFKEKTAGGAYLGVYCTAMNKTDGSRKIYLRKTGTNWRESTLKTSNAPERASVIASAEIHTAPSLVKFDITDYFNECLANGVKEIGFVLDAKDNYATTFATRHNVGNEPRITILGAGEAAGSQRPEFKDYSSQYTESVKAMTFQKKEYVSYLTRLLSSINDYTPVTEKPELSEYGGDVRRRYDEGTGYFRAEKIDGRWWFIDPDGYLMYAYGKANVRPDDNQEYYKTNNITDDASKLRWANEQRDYFKNDLNFNCLGGWSYLFKPLNANGEFAGSLDIEAVTGENNMPFGSIRCYGTSILYGKSHNMVTAGGVDKFTSKIPPVFEPDFEEECEKIVAEYVDGWEDCPWIMGWWSDNEINEAKNMLDAALSLDPYDERYSYTHAATWEWYRKRVGRKDAALSDINDTLREEYREFVYDRYYMIMSKIYKKLVPNHLFLGNRHHDEGKNSQGIMKAAERYCDAYCINLYWEWTPDILAQWEAMYDMPILITEWYARPIDFVNLSGFAGGYVTADSEDAGKFYQNFALRLLEAKNVIGYNFFTAVIGEEQQQYVREFNPNIYDLITYFDEK